MPVVMKKIPEPAWRPAPPVMFRWLVALMAFLVTGVLVSRFFSLHPDNTYYWFFPVVVSTVVWGGLGILRLMFYFLQHIQANAWDRRREEKILQETRRGRRALQILSAEFITAHSVFKDDYFSLSPEALLRNESVLFSHPTRQGVGNVQHSRIGDRDNINMSSEDILTKAFSSLLSPLSSLMSRLPANNTIAVLFESSTSIPTKHIQELWQKAWEKSDIQQSVEYVQGSGLSFIDQWLDTRIQDNAVLLVIALQIAPEHTDKSCEAVVALLLGNRLTQNVLSPIALLHRPQQSGSDELAEGVMQSAYWVPILPEGSKPASLWLSALPDDGFSSVIPLSGKFPLSEITPDCGINNLDNSAGFAGCASPWLAIAAAARSAQQSQQRQMIINGESAVSTLWSTIVSPVTP